MSTPKKSRAGGGGPVCRTVECAKTIPAVLSAVVVLTAFALTAAPTAQAQSFERALEFRSNTNAAYFFYTRPGDASIQVSVWGTVPLPGIYEVHEGTDLEKLITMSGGPPLETDDHQGRRTVTVRLFRPEGAGRSLIYEAGLDDLVLQPAHYPVLADGDMVVVDTKIHGRFNWRDALSITTALASLALVVDRLLRR